MAFKPPGGELSFWSAVWTLGGVLSVVGAILYGMTPLYFCGAVLGLTALGMWFERKWCGYLLAAYFVLVLPLAIYSLIAVDVTVGERVYRFLRVITAGYFAYICYRWASTEEQ